MESVGFKEWALVCEALGCGEQSVILRKGGIAEGRAGFGFRHEEFFLFPTYFHEQIGQVRGAAHEIPPERADEIEIRFLAKLEFAAFVDSWEKVIALEPFHILQREVVRERFEYDKGAGIHLGFVRAYRLSQPWIFPDAPRYGGCRSWVPVPTMPENARLEAIVSDEENQRRREAVEAIAR
jgi:hypothetical protein